MSSGSFQFQVRSPISPSDWNPPSLGAKATSSFLSLSAISEIPEDVFSPALPASRSTFSLSIPTEIVEQVCSAVADCSSPNSANTTLLAAAAINRQWSLPAQRALVRNVAVCTPAQIESLAMKTFCKKPFLARAVRTVTITVARPDALNPKNQKGETGQKAQEQALIGLLPFLSPVKHVRLAATYDVSDSLIKLLSSMLPHVTQLSIMSAYGYSRLVYLSNTTVARAAQAWPKLNKMSLTMPWVLDDEELALDVLSGRPAASLQTVEISGFRGGLQTLRGLFQYFGRGSAFQRLVFDCPIDEDSWEELPDLVESSFEPKQLKELSLWSWTLPMPVSELLQLPQMGNAEHLTLSGQDIKEDTVARFPATLRHVTICQHDEFAPFDAKNIIKQLIEFKDRNKQAGLRHVTIYAPSQKQGDATDINSCWATLVSHGIEVEHSTMV